VYAYVFTNFHAVDVFQSEDQLDAADHDVTAEAADDGNALLTVPPDFTGTSTLDPEADDQLVASSEAVDDQEMRLVVVENEEDGVAVAETD